MDINNPLVFDPLAQYMQAQFNAQRLQYIKNLYKAGRSISAAGLVYKYDNGRIYIPSVGMFNFHIRHNTSPVLPDTEFAHREHARNIYFFRLNHNGDLLQAHNDIARICNQAHLHVTAQASIPTLMRELVNHIITNMRTT
jgi:hypothetical protein